jgi:hypothetical protein
MIILGSITSCLGIGVFFFLIDDPRSPRLHLTEKEKVIMEVRLNDTGIKKSNKINWDQERMFCRPQDLRMVLHFFMYKHL